MGQIRPRPLAKEAPSDTPEGEDSQFFVWVALNLLIVENCTCLLMRPFDTNDFMSMSTARPIPIRSDRGNGPRGWYDGVLFTRAVLLMTVDVLQR